MADVFLSYARTDAEAALRLKSALEELGLSVFIDTESFHAGESFPDRLETEIDEAGAVLSLWNDYALSREWVRMECERALDQKKLLPVEIGPISDRRLTVEFSRLHREVLTDFTGSHNHKGWRKIVKALADRLNRPDILREDTRLKEHQLRAEAERLKERAHLQQLKKQNESLKQRKTGLRPWQAIVGVLVAIGIAATVGILTRQSGQRELAERERWQAFRQNNDLKSILSEPVLEKIKAMDFADVHTSELLTDLFATTDVTLNQLVQASALDADAAFLAGAAYYLGIGVEEEDAEQGVIFLRRACNNGNTEACLQLFNAYAMGNKVAQDNRTATMYLIKGCRELEDARTCNVYGEYAAAGQSPVDAPRGAVTYFRMACDYGLAVGCHNAALYWMSDIADWHRPQVSQNYMQKACDMGHEASCEIMSAVMNVTEASAGSEAE